MADERLPIKFFARREVDNQRVEGGGDSKPPKFMLDGNELVVKAKGYEDIFENFMEQVSRKENKESIVPFVFRAKLIEDAKAKTHRSKVTSLFKVGTENNVIGLSDVDEILVKLEDRRDVGKIIKKLKDVEQYAHAISAIESINEFEPTILEGKSSDPIDYKVKLLDFQNYEQNLAIRSLFEKTIQRLDITAKKTEYTRDHIIYNLKSINLDMLHGLEKNDILEAIFSIEPMPRYTVSLDMMEAEEAVNIAHPIPGKKYTTVGILDNGVVDVPHLKPWLVEERFSAYPEALMKKHHGTFVSGIVVYGDKLENQQWVGTDGVKILDACVFPDTSRESVTEDELVNNIKEAVRRYKEEVKIWNLSISVIEEINEDGFSDFAIALDDIQDECGVLICKSAGNCGNFTKGRPKGKIHKGADSVRSIVVGSIAHVKSPTDLAEVDNPSPFSRIGRGPAYIIKPELVHYGGNASVDGNGDPIGNGVKSFALDGSVSSSIGTSFSTPRIASLAAGLYQEMDEEFDPILLKALMVHSANYSENLKVPIAERVNQVGFGKPKTVRDILYNSPNEVTLILRDEISKSEFIDMMEFPMPDCLVDGEFFTGQIVVTLAYNPILDSSQGVEYCQSDIDVKMGTFDNKKDRDTKKRTILNPVGKDGNQNVLLESNYSKNKIKRSTEDFALKERLLIKYGEKYYPVKKYAVDLSEMTDGNKLKFLTKDKKWFLSLNGLYREHIEKKSELEGVTPRQEFCLIVTIKDPTGTKPVYNEANQKLNEYNFWHNNIKLQTDVTIHN